MNLANAYARLILDAPEGKAGQAFAEKLVAYMKAKGHLSLIPTMLRIAERIPRKDTATVTVRSEADVVKLKPKIKESLKVLGYDDKPEIVVDPDIVGGYTAVFAGKAVDKSFRSALLAVYRNTIS